MSRGALERYTGSMKLKLVLAASLGALLLTVALVVWAWCHEQTTLLIVRHADRDASADALTPAGVARAMALAHTLEKAGVAALYHSNTRRARDSAAPLAAALGLTPNAYPPADASGVVSAVLNAHRGQNIVIVGHSNTVPALIRAAGGPSLPDLDEREFDELFIVSVCACRSGGARLLPLQYGAASP